MEFTRYVARLDALIHEAAPSPADLIGVVWVSESAVIWSGDNGFVEAQPLGASMIAFALHEADEAAVTSRFGDEMSEAELETNARRIASFLYGRKAPRAERP